MWWTKTGTKEDNITVLYIFSGASRNQSRLTVTNINLFQFVFISSKHKVIFSLSSDFFFKEVSGEGFMSDAIPYLKYLKLNSLGTFSPNWSCETGKFWVWSYICQNPNTILGYQRGLLKTRKIIIPYKRTWRGGRRWLSFCWRKTEKKLRASAKTMITIRTTKI